MHPTRRLLAAALIATVILIPATAWATHTFNDVPHRTFYAGPVEWASDNNITTGKTPTSFAPNDGVTRGESVTFLQRYDTNIVQPSLGRIAANSAGFTDNWNGSLLSTAVTVTAPTSGFIFVTYEINYSVDSNATATGIDFVNSDIWLGGQRVSNFSYSILDYDFCCSTESVSVQATIAVRQGTHRIVGFSDLDAAPTSSKLVFVQGRAISAQFVPLDGTGRPPSTFGAFGLAATDTLQQAEALTTNFPDKADGARSQEVRAAWWANQ